MAVTSLGGSAAETASQDTGDWYLDITRPGAPVRMAIPDFRLAPPEGSERGTPAGETGASPAEPLSDTGVTLAEEAAESASVASAVLWSDIEYAGVYRMLPKRFYRIAEAGSPEGVLDYYQWESIGADILVRGTLRIDGSFWWPRCGCTPSGRRKTSSAAATRRPAEPHAPSPTGSRTTSCNTPGTPRASPARGSRSPPVVRDRAARRST